MKRLMLSLSLLTLASACGSDSGSSNLNPYQPSTVNSAKSATPSPFRNSPTNMGAITQSPPVNQFATFGDGTHQVGEEIKPGTYRTRIGVPGCYWERLSGFSGESGSILANDNASGPVIVTIKLSDAGFSSQRCGLWTSDLSAITSSPDGPFSDGMYIVGTDIAPGTWKADSTEGCYWERLRGFTGASGDIVANENYKGIVTIGRKDKGFKTAHCGTWTKIK